MTVLDLRRVVHRASQFWRHRTARVTREEQAQAGAILGPTLAPLFLGMPLNEQRHGLDVLASVARLGADGHLLHQAALLHDLGKTEAGFSIQERSLAVFLRALSPALFQTFLRLRPGFRRRYQIYRDHARIGAARLESFGMSELAAVIAEHHDDNPRSEVARLLRRADLRH